MSNIDRNLLNVTVSIPLSKTPKDVVDMVIPLNGLLESWVLNYFLLIFRTFIFFLFKDEL
jgi:hypothetical protein